MRGLARLGAMRTRAEALMTDTCTVSYASGGSSFNESTGLTERALTERFESRCKVQARDLAAKDAEVGGRVSTTVRVEVHLPLTAPAVAVDDILEITSVGGFSDPHLVGRKFRVVAPVAKSYATARRLDVEEVVS